MDSTVSTWLNPRTSHYPQDKTTVYIGQEATVRTEHEETDWLYVGKEVGQGLFIQSVR